jgi:hypothetical protein
MHMRYLAVAIFCVATLFGGDASVLKTDTKGVELGAFGLRVTAVEGRASVRVAHGLDRVLVTPVTAAVNVSRDGLLLARLSPGKTYYFKEDEQGSAPPPQEQKVVGGGIPRRVLWGVIGGGAAGGIGAGIGLTRPKPTSTR